MPIMVTKKKSKGWTIMDSLREKSTNILEDIGGGCYTNQGGGGMERKIISFQTLKRVLEKEGGGSQRSWYDWKFQIT